MIHVSCWLRTPVQHHIKQWASPWSSILRFGEDPRFPCWMLGSDCFKVVWYPYQRRFHALKVWMQSYLFGLP